LEPLAFVEVMGRHGEVAARHPIWRWPSRVGRSYEMDVILDDPFIAAGHLEIREGPNGGVEVEDLQSINGMVVLPSPEKRTCVEVKPEDVIRIGHTQLRIRPRSYTVAPERAILHTAAYRQPVLFLIVAAVVLATFVWDAYLTTSHRDEKAIMVILVAMAVAAGAVWIAVWSLVGRTVGGRSNFAVHGFVACAGVLALQIWTAAVGYLAFGFDAGWLETLGLAGAAALFAYIVYRHLRLASRAGRRIHVTVAAVVSIVGFGGAAVLTNLTAAMDPAAQSHSQSLKAPFFIMVSGVTPAVFLDGAGDLKREVDAMASN
jgi:hypothetical protein